jgi:hypothetical protein
MKALESSMKIKPLEVRFHPAKLHRACAPCEKIHKTGRQAVFLACYHKWEYRDGRVYEDTLEEYVCQTCAIDILSERSKLIKMHGLPLPTRLLQEDL